MKRILGLGNALVDILIRIPGDEPLSGWDLPKGSMTHVGLERAAAIVAGASRYETTRTSGGSAANTICGLARLGVGTAFIGKTGDDEFGRFYHDDLERHGAQAWLLPGRSATGRAVALITPDSERTFATYLGAAIELAAADLQPEQFRGWDMLHIEGYLVQNHELIESAMRLAHEAGLEISLDLASYNVVNENRPFIDRMVDAYVDILFANEQEAAAFTGHSDPRAAFECLGPRCPMVVVKIGKQGSLVCQGSCREVIGSVPAQAVDTTGAGDLYAAGFLYGHANGLPLEACGRLGSLLGARVVEVVGAKLHEEQWLELEPHIRRIVSGG